MMQGKSDKTVYLDEAAAVLRDTVAQKMEAQYGALEQAALNRANRKKPDGQDPHVHRAVNRAERRKEEVEERRARRRAAKSDRARKVGEISK